MPDVTRVTAVDEQRLAAARRCRALEAQAEDLVGRALATDDPARRIELADEARAAVAALQLAQQEATD